MKQVVGIYGNQGSSFINAIGFITYDYSEECRTGIYPEEEDPIKPSAVIEVAEIDKTETEKLDEIIINEEVESQESVEVPKVPDEE